MTSTISIFELGEQLRVGDIVFIRVPFPPFTTVASATQSWTNHVGVVVSVSGKEPLIAESRFPFSGTTSLSRFIARSEKGRIAVSRLYLPLTDFQKAAIRTAAQQRSGIFYDTGFNLHSGRQFCSRFVYEVLNEATGVKVGRVETFSDVLAQNPDTDLMFWKFWYFGNIPWQRETVTPAGILRSPNVIEVFDGVAVR